MKPFIITSRRSNMVLVSLPLRCSNKAPDAAAWSSDLFYTHQVRAYVCGSRAGGLGCRRQNMVRVRAVLTPCIILY